MSEQQVARGHVYLSPSRTGSKFSRHRSWVWARVKSDPSFPRPVYLDERSPVFVEQQLDDWAAAQAAKFTRAA